MRRGHAHQCHTLATHGDNRGDDVDCPTKGSEPSYDECQGPVIRGVSRRECSRGKGRIGPPRNIRRIAHAIESGATNEAEIEQQSAEGSHPETKSVQAGKCHIARTNLQRHDIVCEPEDKRYAHQKDHSGAMHREKTIEDLRRKKMIVRPRKLNADADDFSASDQ